MNNYVMASSKVRNWLKAVNGLILLMVFVLCFVSPCLLADVPDYWLNVENYGADGSDAVDDTDEINAALAAASSGDVVYFPKGTYRISGQLSWSNKALHLLGFGDATIQETTILNNTPMIKLNTATGSSIKGINGLGAESYESFQGQSSYNAFIYVYGGNNIEIRNCKVTNKSYGIMLYRSYDGRVSDCTFYGFLSTFKTYASDCSGCVILGGSGHIIRNLIAKDMGSGVLIGLSATKNQVADCQFTNMQDNGVYLSSGGDNIVHNVTVNGSYGSGIKARGSRNIVSDCFVKDCFGGYAITGNGLADDEGANGYGTIVRGCIAQDIQSHGISVGLQDGLYGRNFSIIGNQLINCATLGGDAAPIFAAGHGIFIYGNTITQSNGDNAISYGVNSENVFNGAVISKNIISGAVGGIRLRYATGGAVTNNMFKNVTGDCISIFASSQCQLSGNWGVENAPGNIVKCIAADYNTDNVLRENRGSSIDVDKQQNYITNNIPAVVNYAPSVAVAPHHVGQLAKVGSDIYMATGTGSTSYWNCITGQPSNITCADTSIRHNSGMTYCYSQYLPLAYSTTSKCSYKAYMKFDISAIDPDIYSTIRLKVSSSESRALLTGAALRLYGVHDGASAGAGEPTELNWDEPTNYLTWITVGHLSPGNDQASYNGMDSSNSTLLGTFSLGTGTLAAGQVITLSNTTLRDFIRNETNGTVTLVLTVDGPNGQTVNISSRENTSGYLMPTLEFVP